MTKDLNTDIKYVKGVGDVVKGLFEKLSIDTVGDLLHFFPRDYADWTEITKISDAKIGEQTIIKCRCIAHPAKHTTRRSFFYDTLVTDGSGFVRMIFWANRFIPDTLRDGEEYVFCGTVTRNDYDGSLEMSSPNFMKSDEGEGIHAIYRLTHGLSSRKITKTVKNALDVYGDSIEETLPEETLERYHLMGLRDAITSMHLPESYVQLEQARRRLVFEELLEMQLGLHLISSGNERPLNLNIQKDYSEEFEKLLPFELTNAQKRTIKECVTDMSNKSNSNARLTQGQEKINSKRGDEFGNNYISTRESPSARLTQGQEKINSERGDEFGKSYISTRESPSARLTQSQEKINSERGDEFGKSYISTRESPSTRLVQGDVGSGKTAVAASLIYTAVKNGYQAAMMAPTSVLAKQHFENMNSFFQNENINIALLTGATTKKNKEKIYRELKSGEIDLVVGTHALLSDRVEMKNLGLVVTDEQHRFGVKQRQMLTEKADANDDGDANVPFTPEMSADEKSQPREQGTKELNSDARCAQAFTPVMSADKKSQPRELSPKKSNSDARCAQAFTLVMSATPIPRTLGLIIYGDLNISVIDELPRGRQKIGTYLVDSSYHQRIYKYIKKFLDDGKQGYIVCSLVDEKEKKSLERGDEFGNNYISTREPPSARLVDEKEKKSLERGDEFGDGLDNDNDINLISATEYYKELSEGEFKNYRVGLLHGKMKPKEKEQVMSRFESGEIQLLISTVVIEVGVDVPNACVMVIENAERYGLSQLHQLRGRIGRGKDASSCILVTDSRAEQTRERLEILKKTTDGFEIAKKDLELRGPGDFLGQRQHGLPELKLANLMTDTKQLYEARDECERILSEDRELISPKHSGLKLSVNKMMQDFCNT